MVRTYHVLFGGIYLALAAEGTRMRSGAIKLRRLMAIASAALIVAAAGWLIVGAALPASAGRYMFGATWGASRHLVVRVGMAVLGGAAAAEGIAGLREPAAPRASLRARLLGPPIALAVALVAALAGARGFAIGLAGATWCGAASWWRQFGRALGHRLPSSLDEGGA